MKTISTLRPLLVVGGLLAACVGQTQVTFLGNNSSAGDYVGCDNTSPFPLRIMQNDNQPIEWYTSAIQRMQLYPTQTSLISNWNVSQNGFVGISGRPDFFNPLISPGPFSRLHLVDDVGLNNPNVFAQQWGYRPWMRNGITFTGNSDQAYIGQKGRTDDHTDLVLQWSDNIAGSEWGTDRLRFIFTGGYQSWSPHGAYSEEGLESFRVFIAGENDPHVGIGDWWRATVLNGGTTVDPTERLDVLDGRVRIRQLPDDPETQDEYLVMVVDATNDPNERGVVKWKDLGNLGEDCDWTVQPDDDVSTAYLNNTGCPQMPNGVGVGVQDPRAKLHVHHNDYSLLGGSNDRFATWSRIEADDLINQFTGVHGESGPEPQPGFVLHVEGVRGTAYNGKTSIGVNGYSLFDSQVSGAGAGFLAGVKGVAELANPWQSSWTMGVYGWADVPLGTPNAWGGYFEGRGFLGASAWVYSDQDLKQNVEDLSGEFAVGALMQLTPKRYSFNTSAYDYLSLPEGDQIGLISQEVETIFPELVTDVFRPEQLNADGETVAPDLSFKAMNYDGLIPVLIAAVKHQQTQITDQAATNAALTDQVGELLDRMDAMEQLLAACCQNPDADQRSLIDDGTGIFDQNSGDRNLRIQPNPFNEQTTVYYNLERSGRMQLMANSSDGKQLRVLQEAQMEQGEYQFDWQTADLAPGIYYVTLLLDGEPIVKKAVKVR